MKYTVKIPNFVLGCVIGVVAVIIVRLLYQLGLAFYLMWLFTHP
jgi:hypothetical protein